MWLQNKLKLQFVCFFVFLSLQLATNFTRTHVTLTLYLSENISLHLPMCVCARAVQLCTDTQMPQAHSHMCHLVSRKGSVGFLDIVRAGAMNYFPFFCCNLPPLALLLLLFQSQFKLLTHLFRVPDSTLLSGRAKRSWRQCYRHHRTCDLRISGSLSADSYLNCLSL